MEQPLAILQRYWGYSEFRLKQKEIIDSVLGGQDTLALLPTGGGKSICYQVPGLAQEGVCLVVSPLISLMQDQVRQLEKRNIRAIALTSALHYRELDIALENAVQGVYKFIYASPERLRTELFLARLERMHINLVAIDEAHCISQWGYDFRPAYLAIPELRSYLPKVPFLALTATATPAVAKDVQQKLQFKRSHILQSSFARTNLAYTVRSAETKEQAVLRIVQRLAGSGVLYAGTRKATVQWASFLNQQGISAAYYHAGMSVEDRTTVQRQWIQNEVGVICATNAFGMGIDKPDVRFVIHVQLPESPEAYFQEAGRAGRDGEKAYAILLWNEHDLLDLRGRFERTFPSLEVVRRVYHALSNYLKLAIGSGKDERFAFDISAFSKQFRIPAQQVHYSLKLLEKEGYLILSDAIHAPSRFQFIVDNRETYAFKVAHPQLERLIDVLLRSYSGSFDAPISLQEADLARKLQIAQAQVINGLRFLHDRGILDYQQRSDKPYVTFVHERIDERNLRLTEEVTGFLKARAQERLEAMENYVRSDQCRSQQLLAYFGEQQETPCGICDVCLANRKKQRHSTHREELEANTWRQLQEHSGISLRQLMDPLDPEDRTWLHARLREWIDDEKLVLEDDRLRIRK